MTHVDFIVVRCSINMLKCTFQKFSPIHHNVSKFFVSWTGTICQYSIFDSKYSTPNLNNIHEFQDIRRLFTKIRTCADREKDE